MFSIASINTKNDRNIFEKVMQIFFQTQTPENLARFWK